MTLREIPKLSPSEKSVWEDSSFFEAKRTLSLKIADSLALLETELRRELSNGSAIFPEKALQPAGKISRGENLEGYPYLLLDYPRLIQQENILLFRTICWLGHGCTASLIVKGAHREIDSKKLAPGEWLVAYGDDIWNNNPNAPCYQDNRYSKDENKENIRIMHSLGLIEPAALPELAVDVCCKIEQMFR